MNLSLFDRPGESFRRCYLAAGFLLLMGHISAGLALAEEPTPPPTPASSPPPQAATDETRPPATGEPRDVSADRSTPGSDSPTPASATTSKAQSASAVVIEVSGAVDWANAGVSPLAKEGWNPVQQEQRLDPGTQLRTGLRSHVNLRFGETTVISIRSATHASIDQFLRSANSERVDVGLAYGAVRGGSIESTIHSDVRVDSTVATLAKRGTEGWEMRVEPQTGRYRISLAESGLVDAFQKLGAGRQLSKEVRPGEYVTRDSIANLWINQNKFDRTLQFYEASSVTTADAGFSTDNATGYGVLAPGAGSQLRDSTRRGNADFVRRQTAARTTAVPPTTVIVERGPVRRPDGDFGTGNAFKVLIPRTAARK